MRARRAGAAAGRERMGGLVRFRTGLRGGGQVGTHPWQSIQGVRFGYEPRDRGDDVSPGRDRRALWRWDAWQGPPPLRPVGYGLLAGAGLVVVAGGAGFAGAVLAGGGGGGGVSAFFSSLQAVSASRQTSGSR